MTQCHEKVREFSLLNLWERWKLTVIYLFKYTCIHRFSMVMTYSWRRLSKTRLLGWMPTWHKVRYCEVLQYFSASQFNGSHFTVRLDSSLNVWKSILHIPFVGLFQGFMAIHLNQKNTSCYWLLEYTLTNVTVTLKLPFSEALEDPKSDQAKAIIDAVKTEVSDFAVSWLVSWRVPCVS